MNNLRDALIDIATAAFVTNGHPSFSVQEVAFGHWQVEYKVANPKGNRGSLRTAVFSAWEENEARDYYRKKLAEYFLD